MLPTSGHHPQGSSGLQKQVAEKKIQVDRLYATQLANDTRSFAAFVLDKTTAGCEKKIYPLFIF